MKSRIGWLVAGLSLGLLAMGALRASVTYPGALTPLAGLATPGYIAVTVLFTILLIRAGLPLNRLGFGARLDRRGILLTLVAIALLRLAAVTIAPLWQLLLGAARNLERFSGVEGSVGSLVALLAVSWTFAAFGEELAYRIVLMRGISFVLGDSRKAKWIAVLLQALMFGLIHAYQGPTGIAGAATTGLILGAVTIRSQWSIWPAALAHGVNNTIGILSLYLG